MIDSSYSDLTISDLFSGDVELASPPDLYFELDKVIQQPGKSLADAGLIIEKDPNLSAKLLRIVNSAFFGFPAQINTITHALTLIGTTELKNLVLSTLVLDKFSTLPGGMMSMNEFWAMSLRCALFARELEKYMSQAEKPDYAVGTEITESMFLCGLLHEIGLLVFYIKIPELAREVAFQLNASGFDEQLLEQRIIGFDHYQVGAELLNLWRLPKIFVATLKNHQQPQMAGPYARETALLKLASQLSRSRREERPAGIAPEINIPGLNADDIAIVLQQTDEQVDEIISVFCSV